MTTTTSPRIYAADLAAYNGGRLRGIWIDVAGKDADAIGDEIDAMLARSPEPNVIRRRCDDCGRHYDVSGMHHDISGMGELDCPRCGSGNASAPFPSAEEYAIHDHEGFAGLISSEWPDLAELGQAAEALEDDDKRRGLLWLVNDRGYTISDALERCDEVCTYQAGAWDLAADYAQELAADTVPNFDKLVEQWPLNCIDWEDAGRQLLIGGDIDLAELEGERFLVTNAAEF
jgi:antirestriction protein